MGDACDNCPDGPVVFDHFTTSDQCGNDDGVVQRDETIFLDVTVRNPWPTAIPFLVGKLSTTDADVDIVQYEVVLTPEPVPGFGTATAHFVVVISGSHGVPATIPFTVDIEAGLGCVTQFSFTLPLTDPTLGGGAEPVPGEVPNSLRIVKSLPNGLTLTWDSSGVAKYDIYRGNIDTLHNEADYDHIAATGRGACNQAALSYTDGDDVSPVLSPGTFYYLVTGVSDCGLEGTTGFDFIWGAPAKERPAGGGCP